jgi:hypothetical protein
VAVLTAEAAGRLASSAGLKGKPVRFGFAQNGCLVRRASSC